VAHDLLEPGLVDARVGEDLGQPPRLVDAEVLEPVEHVVLGVGRVDGAARLRGVGPGLGLALQRHEPLGVLALQARLDERGDHAERDLQRVGQLRGGALDRRRRVVELVREAGGHRAQRGEPLAIVVDGGQPRGDRSDRAHDAPVHGAVGEGQVDEVGQRHDAEDAVVVGLDAHPDRRLGQRGDRLHPRGRVHVADRLQALVDALEHAHAAREQEQQPARRGVLLGDDLAGGHVEGLRCGAPALELGVVEVVEEVDAPEVVQRDGDFRGHAAARYSWMSDTAIEPSPTAEATRLIERARTSPATNTPGTLVSST
jgi:hypothetical protein